MSEITMSAKAQKIMKRYEQSYVTDTQLEKYLQLGVITEYEYAEIYAIKHPVEEYPDTEAVNG